MQILVVDDDADIRESLEFIVRGEGHDVLLAVDGLDAIERLDAGARPDVIVLDVLMPRLDGFGFLAEKERRPFAHSIPVVVVTAHARVPPHLDGVRRVLRKPFELDALVAALKDAAAWAASG